MEIDVTVREINQNQKANHVSNQIQQSDEKGENVMEHQVKYLAQFYDPKEPNFHRYLNTNRTNR